MNFVVWKRRGEMFDLLDQFKQLSIRHLNIPCQIPAQMYHRYDTLEMLQFVPLVALDGQTVLPGCQWTDIPCNIVAPTDRLHPMHTAGIHPHQITGSLNESIHRYIGIVQVFQHRPPRTVQIVNVVLFAQLLHATPVRVRHGKPFTIAGADVYVNGTEIVVLLMAGRSTARHFHVQLNGVHAEYHVSHMR